MIPQSMDGPVGPSTPTVERRVSIKSTISPLLVEPLCGGLDCIWQSTGICSLQAYIAMRNDGPPNVRPLASDPTRKGDTPMHLSNHHRQRRECKQTINEAVTYGHLQSMANPQYGGGSAQKQTTQGFHRRQTTRGTARHKSSNMPLGVVVQRG